MKQNTKRIVIAGGSGFLGQALAAPLVDSQWDVVLLTRSPGQSGLVGRQVRWDACTLGDWAHEVEGAAAVINLTGKSVNCRYTARNRKEILESRVNSTHILGEAISRCVQPPPVWLNASTATVYRHTFGEPWDESGRIEATVEAKDRFSVEVACAWERALNEASTPLTRKVAMRLAMVLGLGKNSVFPVLHRLTRFGLGGRMGDGRQFVSWIHESDYCRAVEWLISHDDLAGPINLVAPDAIPNAEMMRNLRQVCGAPFGLPATNRMLEVGAFVLGTETELLIKSRRVVPDPCSNPALGSNSQRYGKRLKNCSLGQKPRQRTMKAERNASRSSAELYSAVARIFNLPAAVVSIPSRFQSPADCKSAIQQIENLRYAARGRFLFRLVALALMGAGCFALLQSATGRFLSHDLRYLGMDVLQLCGVAQGKVARFMFHDRVSFGGALIAIGLLYLWLEQVPLKAGEAWAWWTFLLAGLAGFGSFLAYLGYGYLDSWHALASLALLPLYAGGLVLTCVMAPGRPEFISRHAVPSYPDLRIPLGLGRGLLLATGGGLMAGGTTILLIGMTRVFVPQDLRYLKLRASDLLAINHRLVPLIAHDRAAFGGAIGTCGLLLFSCIWFGRPSRSLWQAVALAGSTGFLTAIGVHPLIGYTEFSHLAPAYLGALMFSAGIALCHGPMCAGQVALSHPAGLLGRARAAFTTHFNALLL